MPAATARSTMMLTGLGSLSYGELAGERMKLGLILHDPEEEHDCFSDNTHNSHYYDEVGMIAIYEGSYKRIDGSVVKGASLSELVKAASPRRRQGRRRPRWPNAEAKLRAAQGHRRQRQDEAYDQMIGDGNAEGNKIVQDAIDGLVAQTRAVEKAVGRPEDRRPGDRRFGQPRQSVRRPITQVGRVDTATFPDRHGSARSAAVAVFRRGG